MTTDKFLTDLAALTGCETAEVSFRGYHHEEYQFAVNLFHRDNAQPNGWFLAQGKGPTVEAAMQNARAKLAEYCK